jgi:hypothetical protein
MLHTLSLAVDDHTAGEVLQAVCELTGLRQLNVHLPRFADVQGLPQLLQLRQLTALTFDGPWAVIGPQRKVSLSSKEGGSCWDLLNRYLHVLLYCCCCQVGSAKVLLYKSMLSD